MNAMHTTHTTHATELGSDAAGMTTATKPSRRDSTRLPKGRIGTHNDVKQDVWATQRLARIAGLFYLVVAIVGMFAGTVSTSFLVAGNASATANNVLASLAMFRWSLVAWVIGLLADVAVAVILFVILRPVSARLSLLAAGFRIVYAAWMAGNLLNLFNAQSILTGGAYKAAITPPQVDAQVVSSLQAFATGFHIGLVVFGVHLIALGYLLVRSRYVPRVIGILVVAAGIGYLTDNLGRLFVPGYSAFAVASAVLLTAASIGELVLTMWLLVKGVNVRRPAPRQP